MTVSPRNIILENEEATLMVKLWLQLPARPGFCFFSYDTAAGFHEGNQH